MATRKALARRATKAWVINISLHFIFSKGLTDENVKKCQRCKRAVQSTFQSVVDFPRCERSNASWVTLYGWLLWCIWSRCCDLTQHSWVQLTADTYYRDILLHETSTFTYQQYTHTWIHFSVYTKRETNLSDNLLRLNSSYSLRPPQCFWVRKRICIHIGVTSDPVYQHTMPNPKQSDCLILGLKH